MIALPDVRQPQPTQVTPRGYQLSSAPAPVYPGPTADALSTPPPTPQQVAQAKAEQARQDSETKRVLDNMNIPEVTHYRYSPLDQNKPAAKPAPSTDESNVH